MPFYIIICNFKAALNIIFRKHMFLLLSKHAANISIFVLIVNVQLRKTKTLIVFYDTFFDYQIIKHKSLLYQFML